MARERNRVIKKKHPVYICNKTGPSVPLTLVLPCIDILILFSLSLYVPLFIQLSLYLICSLLVWPLLTSSHWPHCVTSERSLMCCVQPIYTTVLLFHFTLKKWLVTKRLWSVIKKIFTYSFTFYFIFLTLWMSATSPLYIYIDR